MSERAERRVAGRVGRPHGLDGAFYVDGPAEGEAPEGEGDADAPAGEGDAADEGGAAGA